MMRASRRGLLRGALAAAAGALLAACGVEPTRATPKLKRIGLLTGLTGDEAAVRIDAFREGLRELGYVENRDFALEVRYLEGDAERDYAQAQEVVRLGAAVIVTGNPGGVDAARRSSSALPIVLAGVYPDPVVAGVATSLARPGGNVTGVTFSVTTLPGRHLQLLKEVVPGATTIGWMQPTSPGSIPAQQAVAAATEGTARSLGVSLVAYLVRTDEELAAAFGDLRRGGREALLVQVTSGFVVSSVPRIVQFAREVRMPAMYTGLTSPVKAGGFMAGGVNQPDLYRRAASYVDRILKGAKPGDLPIENPTKFDVAINLKTASELGLAVPQSVLSQATEVVR